MFVRVTDGLAETRPIAGTRRGQDPAEDAELEAGSEGPEGTRRNMSCWWTWAGTTWAACAGTAA